MHTLPAAALPSSMLGAFPAEPNYPSGPPLLIGGSEGGIRLLRAGGGLWSAARCLAVGACALLLSTVVSAAEPAGLEWKKLQPCFAAPKELADDFGGYESPLLKSDGNEIKTSEEWAARRAEILKRWRVRLGQWPPLLEKPEVRILETEHRDNFTQHRLMVQVASKAFRDGDDLESHGILMIPDGPGPFPAVLVPFYEPLSSAGLMVGMKGHHDYAYQLAKRGYVTLSIGTPGSKNFGKDTRSALVEIGEKYQSQPLGFLAYVAANCHTVLAQRPEVDSERIGVVGLSYGSKWSMFASCLYDKFACAVWADPGIVFDETNRNINYWEPWYLGFHKPHFPVGTVGQREPGVPSKENPRTGLYKELMEEKAQLIDFHALMAPRPVLVSGGTEDKPERWKALNHLVRLNKLLGHENRVGLTTRETHVPDVEAAEQTYQFFEVFLKPTASKPMEAAPADAAIAEAPYRPLPDRVLTEPTKDQIRESARRAIAVLQKGAANYPKNRDCFSCHHQTLPLLAMRLCQQVTSYKVPELIPTDAALPDSIAKFAHQTFAAKRDSMKEGTGVGGRALTVGYGLWTLDLAEWKRDDTTDAMVAFLLKTQEKDGHWNFQSLRPPGSSSKAMTTALAVYGLQVYGPEAVEQAKLTEALDRARQWFRDLKGYESHEELIGALWGRYLLEQHRDLFLEKLEPDSVLDDFGPRDGGPLPPYDVLLEWQRTDGGWGQDEGMASDAYATGQALAMLAQTSDSYKHSLQRSDIYRRGIRFLIDSQQPDGSWHVRTRAKPVQVYFDNGDPHGKDQFISMMATAWATTALASDLERHERPLASPTLMERERKERERIFSKDRVSPQK